MSMAMGAIVMDAAAVAVIATAIAKRKTSLLLNLLKKKTNASIW